MEMGATISECGHYRYHLWRRWGEEFRITFILLNPSTADASNDDPTLRRCIGFAKTLGAGALDVVNLFAWRATNPKELKTATDPVGPENDNWIDNVCKTADIVIAGWGAHGGLRRRDRKVENLLKPLWPLKCLGRTKAGHPRHPLYLPANSELQTYRMEWE